MTTSTEILRYIESEYSTWGRLQRQKLLYYSQAWSLAWSGQPLFDGELEAWDHGPVARDAWEFDKYGPENRPAYHVANPVDLPDDAKGTVHAVMAFYGSFTGKALEDMTHNEDPWCEAYNRPVTMFGRKVISERSMKRYFAKKMLRKEPGPAKPAAVCRVRPAESTQVVIDRQLQRWAGVNRLLADR